MITISRELGSGAAAIAKRLATHLGLLYLDREILTRAAEQLNVPEEAVASRDETVTPFSERLMASLAYGSPEVMYVPPPLDRVTDREVFDAQSRIISQVAPTRNSVIVGRGRGYILRNHPRHLSIFLHAHRELRVRRVAEVHDLSEDEARAAVDDCDRNRARFRRVVADSDWRDATAYHLCLDTGVLGIEPATDVVMAYVARRFGVTGPE